MNDDRFNFDDELPDWLQDDDQEDDSQPQDTGSEPTGSQSQSLGVTGELPWRQELSDPTASPSSQSSLDDLDWDGLDSDSGDDDADMFATNLAPESSLDWLTDDSFDSSAVSDTDIGDESAGDVPDWLSGPTEFDSLDDSGSVEPMAESDFGASDSLNMDDFDSFFEETAPQAQAEPMSSDDSADWLAEEIGFDEDPVAEPSASDEGDVDLLDFLFDEDFPEGEDEPAADSAPSGTIRRLDAAPPAEAESPQLRRLSDAPVPQPPPPAEEPRRIRKLSEAGKPAESGELTFEEWERQQQQAQFDEEHAEELSLEAEVPDWFQDNVKIGDAADEIASLLIPEEDLPDAAPPAEESTGGVGGDYVPEWFMGLEEQNLDEAPDWVRDAAAGGLTDLTDLSAFAPPPEPEAPPVPETSDSDDWMASFAATPTDDQADMMADLDLPDVADSVPEADQADDADWMADMELTDAAPMSFEETSLEAGDDSDLDSLFGDDDFDMDFGEEPDLVSSSEDETDWMADMGLPQTDSAPPPQVSSPSTGQIDTDSPEWLQGYESPAVPTEAPDLFADQKDDSDMGWLDDVGAADFSDAFAAESGDDPSGQAGSAKKSSTDELIASVDASNLDDLFGMTGPESSLVPVDADTGDDFYSSADGIDDLFDGVDESLFESFSESGPQAPVAAESAASSDDAESVVYEAEGPDWVHEMRPDLQVKLNVGGLNVEFDQQGVNQLPESLQSLRDQAREVVQDAPQGTDEALSSQGPLAGITGGLAISPITTTAPSELELTTQSTIPGHQAQQIDVLEQALAIAYEAEAVLDEPDFDELEDEVPTPQPAKIVKKKRVKRKLDRFFISVILLAALIGPFATEVLHIAEEPDTTAVAVEQKQVIDAVTELDAGDYVLLAFEYGPTAAGELNALAEAVLRDILSQRAIPIVISTNPLGALNGRGVLEKLASDEDLLNALEQDENLVAGEDYYSLRYISGGAVAIRSLSQSETLSAFVFSTDSTGEETNLEFGRLDAEDFEMVFVVGESIDDVRNWAEQFNVPELSKYILVTASAEPLVGAYVDVDGTAAFSGYLAGYRDTYRYNQLRNQRTLSEFEAPDDVDVPDPDISQWHSMAVGALVAGLLIIIGMVFNTLRNTRRRRRV